jgi:hypothetical protein
MARYVYIVTCLLLAGLLCSQATPGKQQQHTEQQHSGWYPVLLNSATGAVESMCAVHCQLAASSKRQVGMMMQLPLTRLRMRMTVWQCMHSPSRPAAAQATAAAAWRLLVL